MPLGNTSTSNIGIILTWDNAVYTESQFTDFVLTHEANKVPKGAFKIVDINSSFIRNATGTYGSVTFTNTTDGQQPEKMASYQFMVDSVDTIKTTASNTLFEVTFHVGTQLQIQKETSAYTGPSSSVLEQIFKKRSTKFLNKMKTIPIDAMTWRVIECNMWEALETIQSRSFLNNDYLYWCYDEVNEYWKITSLLTEKKEKTKYIILDGDNATNPTNSAKWNVSSPDMTIWPCAQEYRKTELSTYKEDLFPNVSFSGFVGDKIQTANFKTHCFGEFLESIGDTSQKYIIENTELNKQNLVYGKLKVLRHWPLNVHQMYSFAETYIKYKLATYKSKVVYVKLMNTVGPPLGSKTAFITTKNDYKRNGLKLDEYYNGDYIVLSKSYKWGTDGTDNSGKDKPVDKPFTTIIQLYSDSLVDESDYVKSLLDKISGGVSAT